jgi:inner membrane protein
MFRSPGLRFIAVGALALLMFIPLTLVSDIVQDRANYSESTEREISAEWGGAQLLSGPVLVVPVTEDVTYERKREATDPVTGRTLRDANNFIVYERYEETVTEDRAPLYLYPQTFDMNVTTESQVRRRGIFTVPVFTAALDLAFDFDTGGAAGLLGGKEMALWDQAELRVHLSSNRALRGEATLSAGGAPLPLEPISEGAIGIAAKTGDPRAIPGYTLKLGMNGAQSFGVAAVGRTTKVTMKSDWPDPSFTGTFLPDTSAIGPDGFTASWTVPHLARSLPQAARENLDHVARETAAMEVRFITPNDFYQKAWRSARYGILFIGLTFLTILLLDRTSERPAHPVQYLMVGLAQSVFVLLMVAYAEQIGFGAAYAVASGATIGLLTLFGSVALKLGRRTGLLAAVLVTVYGVLYLILQSADYALLAGSTLTFVALALTMWLTRNEDWHGPERDGGFRLFRSRGAVPSTPPA